MLALSEFFPATIADAPLGSLILPRSKYDRHGLIASVADVPYFVLLGHEHRFAAFPSTDNRSHKGLIVPDVRIEVDEASADDTDAWDAPLGSVIFKEGKIAIRVKKADSFSGGLLLAELAVCPSTEIVASFSLWQIVVGSGAEKRVLLSIDARRVIEA